MALRLIFMGTPDFSVPVLRAIVEAGHTVVCVYSQPPRPAGRRGLELKPSPVHVAAEALGIPVKTPKSLKSPDEQEAFAAWDADVAVVVAYGLLLPTQVLDAPRHGCLNGHASLLPRWRGAAPIQRAIMAGDRETGMMIMRMDAGLDTGPVALTETTPIMPRTTAGALHDTLSQMCAKLMVEALARLEAGTLSFTPQPDVGITYAHKIDKAEARIDWGQGAKVVQRTIQGLSPAPGAWCELPLGGKPQRTKILDAETVVAPSDRGGPSQRPVAAGTVLDEQLAIACGDGSEAGREGGGAIRPLVLQKAGSKPLPLDAFLAGHSIPAGTVLDQNDVASAGSTGPSNASSS